MNTAARSSDTPISGATRVAILSSLALLATTLPLSSALAAPGGGEKTYYAAPGGERSGECQEQSACSIERVKDIARQEALKGVVDVKVVLTDGTYRIKEPLEFDSEDGGRDGNTVRWEAAADAQPVISDATSVSVWYENEDGIFVADTEPGMDSRQLYVNGIIAPRASVLVDDSDLTITPSGMTIENPDLAYLSDLPNQERIEIQALGDF